MFTLEHSTSEVVAQFWLIFPVELGQHLDVIQDGIFRALLFVFLALFVAGNYSNVIKQN